MALQTITLFDSEPQFKKFLSDEIGCSDKVIKSLNEYQDLTLAEELYDIDTEDWETIGKQCLRPPTGKPVIIPVTTMKKLKAASMAVKYFTWCQYPLTVENMTWDSIHLISEVMKGYSLKVKSTLEKPLLKLRGNGKFPWWCEKNISEMCNQIGIREIPLLYLMRPKSIPGTPPKLLEGLPYSAEYPSVEETIIAFATHSHPLVREDKKLLFSKLEDAWQGTELDSVITEKMRKIKDGSMLYAQALKEYAGPDKWEGIIEGQEAIFKNNKFTGTGTKYTLNNHGNKHRIAYSRLEIASKQSVVSYNLPSMAQRVNHFIESIDCDDRDLCSRIQIIKSETGPDRKGNSIDATLQFLLPVDPVFLRRKKEPRAHQTKGKTAGVSSINVQSGKGKTGVDLRWHAPAEYAKLTQEQRVEHATWMRSAEGSKIFKAQRKAGDKRHHDGNNRSTTRSKKFKAALSAAVSEEMKKTETKTSEADVFAASVIEAVTSAVAPAAATASSTTAGALAPDAESALKRKVSNLFLSKKD